MSLRTHTRAQRAANKRILRGSDICHICGHPGSDAVDHVDPLARGGGDGAANKRPAHHFDPCPTCGIKCNRVKSDKPFAPVIRRSSALDR